MSLVSTLLLYCKNPDCESRTISIRLPCPSQAKISSRPLGQPIAVPPLHVACPKCWSVSLYHIVPQECRFESIAANLVRGDLARTVAISALRPCGNGNCEAHIEIQTLVASGLTIAEVYPVIRGWWFLEPIWCPRGQPGHVMTEKLPSDSYQVEWLSY
jgi:hypothetical protein